MVNLIKQIKKKKVKQIKITGDAEAFDLMTHPGEKKSEKSNMDIKVNKVVEKEISTPTNVLFKSGKGGRKESTNVGNKHGSSFLNY